MTASQCSDARCDKDDRGRCGIVRQRVARMATRGNADEDSKALKIRRGMVG